MVKSTLFTNATRRSTGARAECPSRPLPESPSRARSLSSLLVISARTHKPNRCLSGCSTSLDCPRKAPSGRVVVRSTASSSAGGDLEGTTLNVPRLRPFKPRRDMIDQALTLSINVAGVSFEQRQDLVKLMRVGNAVLLQHEPLNRYDPYAIAVYTLSGEMLGYVPRKLTHLMRQQRYALGIVEAVGPVSSMAVETDQEEEEDGEGEGEGDEMVNGNMDRVHDDDDNDEEEQVGGEVNLGQQEMKEEEEDEEAVLPLQSDDALWYLCITVKPNLPALTIDLVPKTCWGTNLKAELPEEVWDAVRTKVYERAGYRCEVCGDKGDKWPVECQEDYRYDDISLSRHKQTLVGLLALCPSCHKVKHAGRSIATGDVKLVSQQLMRVNRWTYNESQMYLQHAFSVWHERSVFDQWEQDMSWLKDKMDVEPPSPDSFKKQEWEGQGGALPQTVVEGIGEEPEGDK